MSISDLLSLYLIPSGGYLGKLDSNSANGSRSFFCFWGCNMVPVPCSIIGPPRVRGHVPPDRKLSRSLLRFFLPWKERTNHEITFSQHKYRGNEIFCRSGFLTQLICGYDISILSMSKGLLESKHLTVSKSSIVWSVVHFHSKNTSEWK